MSSAPAPHGGGAVATATSTSTTTSEDSTRSCRHTCTGHRRRPVPAPWEVEALLAYDEQHTRAESWVLKALPPVDEAAPAESDASGSATAGTASGAGAAGPEASHDASADDASGNETHAERDAWEATHETVVGLYRAIREGNVPSVKELVGSREESLGRIRDPDDSDVLRDIFRDIFMWPQSWCALQYAAAVGRVEVVETLLAALVDANVTNKGTGLATRVQSRTVSPVDAVSAALEEATKRGHGDAGVLLVRAVAKARAASKAYPARAPLDAPLAWAAHVGNVDVVKSLLQAGASATRVLDGYSPLHWAVRAGQVGATKALLAADADVNCVTDGRTLLTPLHVAGLWCVHNVRTASGTDGVTSDGCCYEVARALIEKGAKIDAKAQVQYYAANSSLWKSAVINGADALLDAQPIHTAAYRGCVGACRALAEAGADINATCRWTSESCDLAVGNRGAGFSPLHLAALTGHGTVARTLLELGAARDGSPHGHDISPLHLIGLAPVSRRASVVEALVEDGADVDARTSHSPSRALGTACSNFTPLHYAAILAGDNGNAVQALVDAGANIEAAASNDMTPLFVAVSFRSVAAVSVLLDARADTEVEGPLNDYPLTSQAEQRTGTALCRAVLGNFSKPAQRGLTRTLAGDRSTAETRSTTEQLEIVRSLVAARANVEAPIRVDRRGHSTSAHTPLQWASGRPVNAQGAILRELIKGGADIEACDDDGNAPLAVAACLNYLDAVQALLEAGAHTEAPLRAPEADGGRGTGNDCTALHMACAWDENSGRASETVRALLLHGADTDAIDPEHGRTPLLLAAKNKRADAVMLLVKAGAAIDARDFDDDTALHHAARVGHADTVRALLDLGACVAAKNKDGKAAETLARDNLFPAVTKLLRDAARALAPSTCALDRETVLTLVKAVRPVYVVTDVLRPMVLRCIREAHEDLVATTEHKLVCSSAAAADCKLAELEANVMAAEAAQRIAEAEAARLKATTTGGSRIGAAFHELRRKKAAAMKARRHRDAAVREAGGEASRACDCAAHNAIKAMHASGTPSWSNSTANQWVLPNAGSQPGWHAFAKLFVAPGACNADVESLDIAGLVTMTQMCKHFTFESGGPFGALRCQSAVHKVKQWRNRVSHSGNGVFDAADVNAAIDHARSAITQLCEARGHAAADAVLADADAVDVAAAPAGVGAPLVEPAGHLAKIDAIAALTAGDIDLGDKEMWHELADSGAVQPLLARIEALEHRMTALESRTDRTEERLVALSERLLRSVDITPMPYADLVPRAHALADSLVGKGSFGSVYVVPDPSSPGGQLCALKLLPAMPPKAARRKGRILVDALEDEAYMLGSLRHENVVQVIGITTDGPCMGIVMEYLGGGDLYDFLADPETTDTDLSWPRRVHIALGCACGLRYLHDKGVVHGDLKSNNVLLDADDGSGRVVIADFGLSRAKQLCTATLSSTASPRSNVRWLAPERMAGCDTGPVKSSCATDVYAFGMLLYEIACRRVPFHDVDMDAVIVNQVKGGARPELAPAEDREGEGGGAGAGAAASDVAAPPSPPASATSLGSVGEAAAGAGTPTPLGIPPEFAALMERCWAQDPAKRPAMADVVAALKALKERLEPTADEDSTSADRFK